MRNLPSRPEPEPMRSRVPVVAAALLVIVLGGVLPIVVARHYGALGIPRSDDWSYLVTQFRWTGGGGLGFNHWVTMTLIGQLLLSLPIAKAFPGSIAALQLFTAAFGVGGLAATVILVRRCGGAWTAALLVAASIGLSPLWGPLAASYMTDVPALTVSVIALACGTEALRRDAGRDPWLLATLLAGVIGFSIRQYAAIPAVTVFGIAIWEAVTTGRRRDAIRSAALLGAFLLASLMITVWWSTVPAGRAVSPQLPDPHSLRVVAIKAAGFVRLGGLILAPLLAWCGIPSIVRRAWRASPRLTGAVGIGGALLLATTAAVIRDDLFVGNYVVHNGVLSDIVMPGPRPDVLPAALWFVVVAAASAMGVVLLVAAVPFLTDVGRRLRDRDLAIEYPARAALIGTVLAYAAVYAIATACGIQMYDRYILPMLPPLAALLATSPRPVTVPVPARSRSGAVVMAVVALAGVAFVGLAFTLDSASFDGARWRAAVRATGHGWGPRQIGGGFEWVDFHARNKVTAAMARDHPVCVTVHVNPRVAPGRVVTVAVSHAPTRPDLRIVAYRTGRRCVPEGHR